MACQDEFVRARERAAGFHEEGTRGGGEWGQPHLEPADELAEVRPLVRVLAPAEAHDLLQGIREVVLQRRGRLRTLPQEAQTAAGQTPLMNPPVQGRSVIRGQRLPFRTGAKGGWEEGTGGASRRRGGTQGKTPGC